MDKTLSFLKKIKKNNHKEWFETNKYMYFVAKQEFELVATDLILKCSKFDDSLKHINIKKCFFRFYRNVRFSKDKSPYKKNFACYFNETGKKMTGAGYYLHIEPQKSFIAGGIYQPKKDILKIILEAIDFEGEELINIINQPSFKKYFKHLKGDKLKRVPKPFKADNSFAEYLKMKDFLVSFPLNDTQVSNENLIKEIIPIYKEMFPLVKWLNEKIKQAQVGE